MGKIRIIIIILFICIILGCNNSTKNIGLNNKFKTEYRIYYSTGASIDYKTYTDSETFVCSFNGTNYLLEKGNGEELVSTTAPIRILKITKFDENGKETEYTGSY